MNIQDLKHKRKIYIRSKRWIIEIIQKIIELVGEAPVHLLLGVSDKEKYIPDLKDEYTRSKT